MSRDATIGAAARAAMLAGDPNRDQLTLWPSGPLLPGTSTLPGVIAENAGEGLAAVTELVGRFRDHERYYLTAEFDEASTRETFIDPLFEALGWDVADRAGRGPARDVIFHRRVTTLPSVAGEAAWDDDLTEAELAERVPRVAIPDYAFRSDSVLRFYVEAKKPGVGVEGKASAYQVKSYAWAERLPVSVLTDFRRLRLFDTRNRPEFRRPVDGIVTGWDLAYADYAAQWSRLWATLSREAVAGGSLSRLVGTAVPRGWLRIDEAFLQDLTRWRQELAQDLLEQNEDLDRFALSEATQRILDRLIFLRVVEDRVIEPTLVLRRFARRSDAYRNLVREFRRLDSDYNGQLFAAHFSEGLEVSDGWFQRLVESLYPPRSPYRFAVVSPDILGAVYERFLGADIVVTDKVVTVAEKPEVRHSGGVYYTPDWVVRRIVEQTLEPLTTGSTPETVRQLRILDPACGSGSFLLGALDHLIRWHEAYYSGRPDEDKKLHYLGPDGHRRLTMDAKAQILANCIYGVDVDPQAVEVAQMSLYLRILDLETQASLTQQSRLFHGAILPLLSSNILCGNTLLGPEDVPSHLLFDDELARRINPFAWRDQRHGFGKVFADRGGFDAIIGNPPYTRVQVLRRYRPEEDALYQRLFRCAKFGSYDIAMIFVERCMEFLRPPRRGGRPGRLSFIISRQFAEMDAGQPLRELLSEGRHVVEVIDFADGLVFGPHVGAYTVILTVTSGSNSTWQLSRVPAPPSADALKAALRSKVLHAVVPAQELTADMWTLALPAEAALLQRMAASFPTLEQVSGGAIFQGVVTGADEIFRVLDTGARSPDGRRLVRPRCMPSTQPPMPMEDDLLRPIYAGRTAIGPFRTETSREWVILPYARGHLHEPYVLLNPTQFRQRAPGVWEWLSRCEDQLRSRSGRWNDLNWFAYSRRQNLERFDSDTKVMVPYMVERLCSHLDRDRHFFVNVSTGGYGVGLESSFGVSWEFLAALLNSELLSWALRRYSRTWRGGWFAARAGNLELLPIATPPAASQAVVVQHYDDCVTAMTRRLQAREGSTEAEMAQRALDSRLEQFDRSIFELYGVSDAELAVIRSGS